MNLLLLEPADVVAPGRALISDRRASHLRRIVKVAVGDPLRVGVLGGEVGHGQVERIDDETLELSFVLEVGPPPPAPVELALALPRPPTLEKVIQQGTALGIKRFHLFQARRVEKSYWTSSALEPEALRRHAILGLEQARDTVLPEFVLHRRFRPFVEDELPRLAAAEGSRLLYAHPSGATACPHAVEGPVLLVVGPEGGLVDFEVDRLDAVGAVGVHLGPRILRVETAVVTLLGRLLP